MKMKNPDTDTGVLFLHCYKNKCNVVKKTCLLITGLFNLTTNTSIRKNGKQVNKNTQTTL